VLSVAARAGQRQRTSCTLPGVCHFTARPPEATTMQTDAHNMGREERRAQLEQTAQSSNANCGVWQSN
jgi:hypothetical protein